ncbi:MAG: PAS domain S-box protein [Deltaproteobacteria bacterium]|nr:PAS domain S-box protein [Deltaproteobacteria bacterium]
MTGPPSYEELEQRVAELQKAIEKRRDRNGIHADLELLLSRSPDALVVYDTHLRYTYINEAGAALLGMIPKEVIGKTNREVMGPGADTIEPYVRRAFEMGEKVFVDHEIPLPTGKRIFDTVYTPVTDQSGQEKRVIGVCRDVTDDRARMEILEKRVRERTAELKRANERLQKDIAERRRIEEELQREQAFSEMIVHTANALIVTLDENACITSFNEHAERLTGYSRDEVLHRSWIDTFIPVEQRSQIHQVFGKVFHGEDLFWGLENPILCRDGSLKTLSWHNSLLKDESGHTLAVLSIGIDITDRKRALEALSESEASIKSIMEAAPVGIGLVHNRVFGWLSDRFLEMTGYVEKELIGMSARLLYESDEEFRRVGEMKYAQIDREGIGEIETRFRRKDGSLIDVLMRSTPIDPDDRDRGVVFTAMDITERKRAKEAIESAERRYRSIFENATEGIFQSTPQGAYISANPALARIYGYDSPEELIENITDIGRQLYVDPARRVEFIRRLEEEDAVTAFEAAVRRKGGNIATISVNARAVRDPEGRILFMEGSVEDVTEQREMEEARTRLEDQLRQAQKMEAIGTLAGGIAHDFNNILGIIIGYAEMMEMFDAPAEGPMRSRLNEILKASHRAKDLVHQILTFSRQSEQERKPVQVAYILKETVKFLRASLPATIEIRQRIESNEGAVLADPTQMHQVLMNLCTNAAHAMREKGGVLEVFLEDEFVAPAHPEEQLDLKPGPYIKLTVSDTGSGIPEEVLARIFDPYFTTKGKGEGTGLGLAVVHGIVKTCGGAIRVASRPGEGTSFGIFFPMFEKEKGAALPIERGPLPTGGAHILFVDDEKPLVDLGRQMLERLGYRVTPRTGSLEALEAFRSSPDRFDLVITDQTMPNMVGMRLAEEIKKARPDIPIIVCTGFSDALTPEKVEMAGLEGFLLKPLHIRALAETLHRVLKKG